MIPRSTGISKHSISKGLSLDLTAKDYKLKRTQEQKIDSKKRFIVEWKNLLNQSNKEIISAVKEDKEDKEVLSIIYNTLENYSKINIQTANYEEALSRYCYEIDDKKAKNLYPNIESIDNDFKVKMHEEITRYGLAWIEDFRIKYTLGKYVNSIINAKLNLDYDHNQILEYLLQKYSNIPIDNMPNLKSALTNRINRIIEEKNKMKSSEKNG